EDVAGGAFSLQPWWVLLPAARKSLFLLPGRVHRKGKEGGPWNLSDHRTDALKESICTGFVCNLLSSVHAHLHVWNCCYRRSDQIYCNGVIVRFRYVPISAPKTEKQATDPVSAVIGTAHSTSIDVCGPAETGARTRGFLKISHSPRAGELDSVHSGEPHRGSSPESERACC